MISEKLLKWYDSYGRLNLPWRLEITPYRVWLSEIMLQQTQVATVTSYFLRFISRFPTLLDLANATEDDVLHLWSGLGYYSRARNLLKSAIIIRDQFQGEFPKTLSELIQLPGIGRSTAGAILSIAFNQPTPILDGNVKRVLTRLLALHDWPGSTNMTKILWEKAEEFTPKSRVADYTQAIMDLGATICTRTNPNCGQCPLQIDCAAFELQLTSVLPKSKPKKELPIKSALMLLIQNPAGEILLEKRPPTGIWGGLWCLPTCELQENISEFCHKNFALEIINQKKLTAFRHTFSHFHLDIFPLKIMVTIQNNTLQENNLLLWYNISNPQKLGLAAPIKKLLTGEQQCLE